MVTVKFCRAGNHLCAECAGHATGSTEVCAAVSAVMSVLSAVARECEETDGKYTAKLGLDIGSETVFRAVAHTIDRIAITYPELVRVEDLF